LPPEKSVTKEVLKALSELGAANPGDVVAKTGLPRYLVLAAFQVLHELGYVAKIYDKGSHKIYVVSEKGKELLEEHVAEARAREEGALASG